MTHTKLLSSDSLPPKLWLEWTNCIITKYNNYYACEISSLEVLLTVISHFMKRLYVYIYAYSGIVYAWSLCHSRLPYSGQFLIAKFTMSHTNWSGYHLTEATKKPMFRTQINFNQIGINPCTTQVLG